MYLDFEDYRPDIQPIGRAISWREGILISIIVHLAMVIVLLLLPRLFPYDADAARARAILQEQRQEPPRFVFVQPRLDTKALRPPDLGEASDQDRRARARERAPKPNELPFSRGNTPERVESIDPQTARGRGPAPDPAAGRPNEEQRQAEAQTKLPESSSALQYSEVRPPVTPNGVGGRSTTSGGVLGQALKNLQPFMRGENFDNPQGGGGQFGPDIQFDTKGVEFGPWIRRFIAQVKRNWLVPNSAMMLRGHVVITFNVHKDGAISDLTVAGPCPIESFNTAAFGALKASNPTEPLPPEYPSEKAFFTVTFFYNETPPR